MDPHLGKRRSDEACAGNGTHGSSGSRTPSEEPRSGSDPLRRRYARGGRRDPGVPRPTLAQALASGWSHALELGDYVRSLLAVRKDRALLEVRRKTTKVGIFAFAAVGAGTIVIAASVRLVAGMSDGLAVLFGGRGWLGDLATAAVLLGGLAGAGALYLKRWEKKELEKQIEKYERHHREHRTRHGHHVADPSSPDAGGAPRP